jgi:aromatic amino acid aminotransferase I
MSPAPIDIVKPESDTTAVVVPDPLSINGLASWRIKGSVQTGTAAAANSDMFKSQACYTKPKAKRWDRK